jgi:hypothetical protein
MDASDARIVARFSPSATLIAASRFPANQRGDNHHFDITNARTLGFQDRGAFPPLDFDLHLQEKL